MCCTSNVIMEVLNHCLDQSSQGGSRKTRPLFIGLMCLMIGLYSCALELKQPELNQLELNQAELKTGLVVLQLLYTCKCLTFCSVLKHLTTSSMQHSIATSSHNTIHHIHLPPPPSSTVHTNSPLIGEKNQNKKLSIKCHEQLRVCWPF